MTDGPDQQGRERERDGDDERLVTGVLVRRQDWIGDQLTRDGVVRGEILVDE